MSRRRILPIVLAATASIALTGGCGSDDSPNRGGTAASAPPSAPTAPPAATAVSTSGNPDVCDQADVLLAASDSVSSSHGDTPVIRVGLYQVTSDRLAPLTERAGGDVKTVLDELVATMRAATDPLDDAERARLVRATDARLTELRGRLDRACGTT